MRQLFTLIFCFNFLLAVNGQVAKKPQQKLVPAQAKKPAAGRPVLPGAYLVNDYLPMLQGKRVGVFANHTSLVGNTHLVDTLQKRGIVFTKIFGPEHGFRGTADAGEKVDNYIDKQTGIPVVSLYGKKHKPTADDLADVDVMLFDIQDVGVRFYTFISSLQSFMEAAIDEQKPLIILDRPNPNGFYVDGPVLDTAFRSFVGMQPIPVVYGMTIGEYANFLIGEGLLDKEVMANMMVHAVNNALTSKTSDSMLPNITVIKCRNYTHNSRYNLPVKPSPNLPDSCSVYYYPSTCFFEGTVISEGRGTPYPFQIFGHPSLPETLYAFTPVSTAGARNPKHENKVCFGWNMHGKPIAKPGVLQLHLLLNAYKLFPDKANFFTSPKKENVQPTDYFFNKLAGNATLMKQIKEGKTGEEIRASWQPALEVFKAKRKKYLMYP